jgi:hypothetical protein
MLTRDFFPPEKNWMLTHDFFLLKKIGCSRAIFFLLKKIGCSCAIFFSPEKKLKCFFSSSSYPAQQHYNERNNGTTAPEPPYRS